MGAVGGTIVWFRRDLRTADHAALSAAAARGEPVVGVFVLDPETRALLGAAPAWRLSRGLAALEARLASLGCPLFFVRGPAVDALRDLAARLGADAVYWSRVPDPATIDRDAQVKTDLSGAGLEAKSFSGHLLVEPYAVAPKAGGFFQVYTPFTRAARPHISVDEPLPAPTRIATFDGVDWDAIGEPLAALGLETAMNRGAAVVARHEAVGEDAARDRLAAFVAGPIARYHADRDRLDRDGTSRLSAHLSLGELSPRQAWVAAEIARGRLEDAEAGVETFQKELLWREFSWHVLYNAPSVAQRNLRAQWDAFPWRSDNDEAELWRRGRTGVPVVDAAMRELYVSGRMHNRARMLTASYLTKNLLTDWRVGEAWFRECLVDWDPASNVLGWQWAAGSGADAAPFFRIFNPDTQAEKFDPEGLYRSRWLPDGPADLLGAAERHPDGLSFFDACPRSWGLTPTDPYPAPRISQADARVRALDAYAALRREKETTT